MRRRARVLFVSLSLLGAASCQKEAKLPAAPKKCGKVERASDRVIDVVMCADADGDEDGVDDAVDLCLKAKEISNGLADKDGCPDPDRDQDLFVDYEDACPDDKGVTPDGCPGVDSDGDLIADHLDSCPSEKEDNDGDRDDDGCPDGAQVNTIATALDQQLWQRARIDVTRGRAAASKDGSAALEELVKEVATRPGDVKRVRIVGYASLREVRRGKAKELAKQRVKLVESRLAEAGVAEKAIERAIYPLKDRRERVGRVDVMVFLDLESAMAGDQTTEEKTTEAKKTEEKKTEEKKTEGKKPAEGKTTEQGPVGQKPAGQKPADEKPGGSEKPPDENWDQKAAEPYPEPERAPADEDWDLVEKS